MQEAPLAAIEDNYPEYYEDSAGLRYDAWDTLSQAQLKRIDEISQLEDTEISGQPTEALVFEWFKARVLLRAGRYGEYLTHVQALLTNPQLDKERWLNPMEIYELSVDVAVRLGDVQLLETWRSTLQAHTEPRAAFIHGLIETLVDQSDDALRSWVETQSAKAEACVDIAQALIRHQKWSQASQWLTRASEYAQAPEARAARVDIALMQARLDEKTPDDDHLGFESE